MQIEVTDPVLTDAIDAAEAKRLELETSLGKKVKMIALKGDENDICFVYFLLATTETKKRCIDLSYSSLTKAEDFYFTSCVIRDGSDARVFKKDNDEDVFYLAALSYCGEQINTASRIVKKK